MKSYKQTLIKYILSIVFCSILLPIAAQDTENQAIEAYRNEDYKKSIELYEQLANNAKAIQKESAEIYYNLGNSYFRNNQISAAILNYERALLIKPGDADIRHNLRFARTRIEDKIDSTDSFFLAQWFHNLQNIFTSNTWAWISAILFLLLICCVAAFIFVRILWLKKTAFYTGIVLVFIIIATNMFAFKQKRKLTHRDSAIVMVGAASINAEPNSNSNELFQLHEGTKVKIRNTDSNWYEVEIANGSIGWTLKDNVEVI